MMRDQLPPGQTEIPDFPGFGRPEYVARWAEVRVRPVLRLAGDTEIPDFPGFGRPEYVARWAEVRVRPVLRLAGDVVTPCLWELEPKRIELARRSLDQISRWWDEKLAALKASVEDER